MVKLDFLHVQICHNGQNLALSLEIKKIQSIRREDCFQEKICKKMQRSCDSWIYQLEKDNYRS
jgi:hypothetical protein